MTNFHESSTSPYEALPSSIQHALAQFAEAIQKLRDDRYSLAEFRSYIAQLPNLEEVLLLLSGNKVVVNQSLVNFGEGSSLGDISISDIAGNNLYKFNISLPNHSLKNNTEHQLTDLIKHFENWNNAIISARNKLRRNAQDKEGIIYAYINSRRHIHHILAIKEYLANNIGTHKIVDEVDELLYILTGDDRYDSVIDPIATGARRMKRAFVQCRRSIVEDDAEETILSIQYHLGELTRLIYLYHQQSSS